MEISVVGGIAMSWGKNSCTKDRRCHKEKSAFAVAIFGFRIRDRAKK